MLIAKQSLGNVSLAEARSIQQHLREKIEEREVPGEVRLVAGLDISGLRGESPAIGAAILLSYPGLIVVEQSTVQGVLEFPYVPGFLSFREAPLMLKALRSLHSQPDVVIVEGHGKAHPRGFGSASHIGVILGRPTIGFAKSRLVGHFDEPGPQRGSISPLIHRGEVVGSVVRTRDGVKPVFVSVGNLVTLEQAVKIVLGCAPGRQRLPEPIRLAHIAANEARKELAERNDL